MSPAEMEEQVRWGHPRTLACAHRDRLLSAACRRPMALAKPDVTKPDATSSTAALLGSSALSRGSAGTSGNRPARSQRPKAQHDRRVAGGGPAGQSPLVGRGRDSTAHIWARENLSAMLTSGAGKFSARLQKTPPS